MQTQLRLFTFNLRRNFHSSPSRNALFDKILVANRGEIACRIMKSCKKLGIKTVAVYSEVDLHAKHVETADEAVNIGPAPSSASYLRIDKIMEAIKKTGAKAVHPGYGFLSENNHFVADLEKENVVFIGPGSHAMHAMGDKIESKKIAKEAKVNVIPGYLGVVETPEEAIKISNEIGYPVMIKASAGGGGKGMRIAYNDEQTKIGFRLSKEESLAAFGDDRLLIERFIENPRHIEIQVLCDSHGNRIYLNERECSIQRRNQKVVEEAPSPFLTPEVRKAMGEQALALCQKVGYVSAGTVEFLVDPKRQFYFLEMNTRLQVEHPITEYITGIDIVEWMIKIAAGEKLTIKQSDVPILGWAMESRVYAEDPYRNFLPSIGRLTRYKEPGSPADPNIRVDSGVLEGSDISIYYDPLISKLATHGKNRMEAIEKMEEALDSYVIHGLNHNVAFLREVTMNKKFREGDISTKFIPQEFPEGFKGHILTENETSQLVSLAACIEHLRNSCEKSVFSPNHLAPKTSDIMVKLNGKQFSVKVENENEKLFTTTIDNKVTIKTDLTNYPLNDFVISWSANGEKIVSQLIKTKNLGYDIQFAGTIYSLQVTTKREAELLVHMKEIQKKVNKNALLSPMAGTLISVAVKPGDFVKIGQELATVEAMKMRNVLTSEKDGVIKSVSSKIGKAVQLEEIILEFENEK